MLKRISVRRELIEARLSLLSKEITLTISINNNKNSFLFIEH